MTDAKATAPASEKDLAARWRTFLLYWGIPLALLAVSFGADAWMGPLWSIAFTWIGIACTANALHCGRVHCSIMGPLFLILGGLAIANTVGWLALEWDTLGQGAGASVLVAYAPECLGLKYWPRRATPSTAV